MVLAPASVWLPRLGEGMEMMPIPPVHVLRLVKKSLVSTYTPVAFQTPASVLCINVLLC